MPHAHAYGVLPTAELVPYARNARTHTGKQIEQIAASMREFGFTNPVLVDEERVIIAGHGRVLAAQALAMERLPVVHVHGLSLAQRNALRLADNKLAESAGWDDALLRLELGALKLDGFDLALTGFSNPE